MHPPPGLQMQSPHGMVMGPNSTYPPNTSMMNPNQNPAISSPAARFPFNTLAQPPQSQPQPQPQPPQPKMESLNSGGNAYDGSTQMRYNTEPAVKKKRGRPRKYTPDGGIALQLAPTSPVPLASVNHGDSVSLGSNGGGGGAAASEQPTKKHRGRPPGSGKKQLDALGKLYLLCCLLNHLSIFSGVFTDRGWFHPWVNCQEELEEWDLHRM